MKDFLKTSFPLDGKKNEYLKNRVKNGPTKTAGMKNFVKKYFSARRKKMV